MMSAEKYGEAYQTYFNRTVKKLIHVGASSETAREIAQAAWAKGWESIDSFRNESAVLTWIHTIARRKLVDHNSRGLWRNTQGFDFEPMSLDRTLFTQIDISLQLQLCRLDERDLIHQVLQGFTKEEIAGNLGVPLGTIKSRFSSLYKRLRLSSRERTEERARQTAEEKAQQEAPNKEASSFTKELLF